MEPVTTEESPPADQLFLRRVGTRALGEVDVPPPREDLQPPEHAPGTGLRPQAPGEDLGTPAYSRKYMD